MPSEASPTTIPQAFRFQSVICRALGSELYAGLLDRCAQNIEAEGPVARVVRGWRGDPLRDFVAVRLMAGVHRLVLSGAAPELASYYPSAGGDPREPGLWTEFLRCVASHADELRAGLETQPQTNEVGRSAAMLSGFHIVAREGGLPLRLRELGASAGLNLLWDRYRYRLGDCEWGPEDTGVVVAAEWSGPAPPLVDRVEVESRRGCDLAPVAIGDAEARRSLESFVWADQTGRLARLRSAIDLAIQDPPTVERASASSWLVRQLRSIRPGVSTVVFHSAFWLYLSPEEQRAITEMMEEAGKRASSRAPLAWLRMEDDGTRHPDIWLRIWPPGEDRHLAEAHNRGEWIRWLDGSPSAESDP